MTKHKAHWHATESHSVRAVAPLQRSQTVQWIVRRVRESRRDQFPMKLISQMREKGDWYAVASQTVSESMTSLFQMKRFFLW